MSAKFGLGGQRFPVVIALIVIDYGFCRSFAVAHNMSVGKRLIDATLPNIMRGALRVHVRYFR